MTTKRLGVVDVTVKDAGDGEGHGEFEAVLSTASLDRDGEVVETNAFDPLPDSIVIHTDHVFSVDNAVARAVPSYEDGKLILRGYWASDVDAQKVRQKVRERIITTMSAGFMAAKREIKDGVPHITRGELLEGSFVTVPSNRDALVLAAKSAKVTNDMDLLQKLHDLAASQGAVCEHTKNPDVPAAEPATDPEMAAAPAAAKSPADVARIARVRVVADAASVL